MLGAFGVQSEWVWVLVCGCQFAGWVDQLEELSVVKYFLVFRKYFRDHLSITDDSEKFNKNGSNKIL